MSYQMNVAMNRGLAERYTSSAQQTKAVTEAWVTENLYCPACDSESLAPTPPSTPVVDFLCDSCDEEYQLKGQRRPFGRKVRDAAYSKMIDRVTRNQAPNFLFLHYDALTWRAQNLFMVPRYFVTPSAIERRPRLKPHARRAGWEGCDIVLAALPPDAWIPALREETPAEPKAVREAWRRFGFLKGADSRSRGWLADVLACVRAIRKEAFSLSNVYVFEGRLARLHPENRHVRPKIRQQLQLLRDRGVLEFLGSGRYRILLMPQFD